MYAAEKGVDQIGYRTRLAAANSYGVVDLLTTIWSATSRYKGPRSLVGYA